MKTWKISLINDVGEEIAYELGNMEEVTTKEIGELNWALADGDKIVIEEYK